MGNIRTKEGGEIQMMGRGRHPWDTESSLKTIKNESLGISGDSDGTGGITVNPHWFVWSRVDDGGKGCAG